MGEAQNVLPGVTFNRAVRVETRPERLSSEAGVVVLRELLERAGAPEFLRRELHDPRDPQLVPHPISELGVSSILLIAQGWRDEDDADPLRDDPLLRLAVSERKGLAPLRMRPRVEGEPLDHNPAEPDGLASQPTLSRFMRIASDGLNRCALRRLLLHLGVCALHTRRDDLRRTRVTLDIDSLPIEVHGHQDGSEHNGHYHARVFHPLAATVGESGELLDMVLREGACHTADGALDFILPLVDDLEEKLVQVVAVRIDAGFPCEPTLDALEKRRVAYVSRLRNNSVLDRLAAPFLRRPPGRPPAEPRTWFHEQTHKAGSWSHERRVVLVAQERPGELLLHHFWLVTNLTVEQLGADPLLDWYRQRGTAEGHQGELMSVLAPALSSVARPKAHYQGHEPQKRYEAGDSFEINEARLLLYALAYATMHLPRRLLAMTTHQGWSLRRVRERVLRVAARVVIHARRALVVIDPAAARLWQMLWKQIAGWHPTPA